MIEILQTANQLAVVLDTEKFAKIDYKKTMRMFEESIGLNFKDFILNEENGDKNVKIIVFFLRHIYNNSLETVKTYNFVLCSFFNDMRKCFRDVNYADIQEYLERLRTQKMKIRTINLKLSVLKSFFHFLTIGKFVHSNPTVFFTKLKGETELGHSTKVLAEEDLSKIICFAKNNESARDYLVVAILFYTGIRASELGSLRWKHLVRNVQGDKWYLSVTGKGSKQRSVYVPFTVVKDIMTFREATFNVPLFKRAEGLDDLPIVPSMKSATKELGSNSIYKIVAAVVMRAVGKKVSPHWMRHSFATHARLSGASLQEIRDQLGHSSIRTTEIYESSRHLIQSNAGQHLEGKFEVQN